MIGLKDTSEDTLAVASRGDYLQKTRLKSWLYLFSFVLAKPPTSLPFPSKLPKNKRKQNLKAAADSYNGFSVLDESEWIDESDTDVEFSSYHPT